MEENVRNKARGMRVPVVWLPVDVTNVFLVGLFFKPPPLPSSTDAPSIGSRAQVLSVFFSPRQALTPLNGQVLCIGRPTAMDQGQLCRVISLVKTGKRSAR